MGSHGSMANRIMAQLNIASFSDEESFCQKTSIAFVDSIFEILGPLSFGFPLVVLGQAISDNPALLVDELSTRCITRLTTVPSLARVIADTPGGLRRRPDVNVKDRFRPFGYRIGMVIPPEP